MNTVPKHEEWTEYSRSQPAKIEKVPYECLRAVFYSTYIDDIEWSCGLFYIDDTPIMTAWGPKNDTHCSMHAVKINGEWSDPLPGCPVAKPILEDEKCIGVEFSVFKNAVRFVSNGV